MKEAIIQKPVTKIGRKAVNYYKPIETIMNNTENLPSNSCNNMKGSVGRDLVILLQRMDLEALKNEKIAMLLSNKIQSKNCIQFKNEEINRKFLRPRQECNYNELSFDKSNKEINLESRTNQHVPVYKQNKNSIDSNTNLRTPKIDLYEFDDFDSESNLRRKAKRSSMFDKTTHDILKKIENMEMIKSKVKKKNRQLRNKQKYNKKIQNIVSGVINKIKNRTEKVTILSDDKHSYNLTNRNAEPKDINRNVVSATSNDLVFDCVVHSKIENKSPQGKEILDKSKNDDENYFGFKDDGDHCSLNSKRKIVNVVSNVLVRRGNYSPAAFEPNANSTMCGESSPWRFQPVNLWRNPYLLKLKESSLPSLDQDAVLDHTVEEKMSLKQNTHTGLVHTLKQHSSVQKNLLDYFEHENNENKENTYPQGLFNYNEANSPVKVMTQRNLRHRLIQSTPLTSSPLRPIFEDNTDNIKEQKITSKRLTYFGFDISSDLIQNSEFPKSDETRPESSKPFRCNLNKILKQYGSKSKIHRIRQQISEEKHITVLGSSTGTECVQGTSEAQLFEDPEDVNKYKVELPSPVVVEKKKRLRKHSSSKDENFEAKHRKKKNLASRVEEEELEKWAAAFNSTCAEIEKHELEIE